jgi:hypothetical protein
MGYACVKITHMSSSIAIPQSVVTPILTSRFAQMHIHCLNCSCTLGRLPGNFRVGHLSQPVVARAQGARAMDNDLHQGDEPEHVDLTQIEG